MLIQFNFENYKTYFKATSLDMTATNITELESNIFNNAKSEKYLKVASIFGANASGKSNILDAFKLMRLWVLNSFKLSGDRKSIPLKRFQFCEKGKNGRSMFEVFFENNNVEYQYGFSLDDKKIFEEWLYKRDFRYKSKYNVIFERKEQKFNLNDELKKAKDILNSINERTLLVSVLSNLEIQDAINVLKWFEETEVINFGDTTFEFFISRSLPKVNFDNELEYKKFLDFLIATDVGIEGIRIEKHKKDFNNIDDDSSYIYKIYTQHKNIDTNSMEEILLSDESSGTIKMISLYYYLYQSLSGGKTIFIDEMDAKLHPLLTRYIINLFQSDESNPNNAQLIFTTHDTNILNKEVLRRDQIWFVEKDSNGMSELYSLAEYKINNAKIRKDASYIKDYLGGRYGAIPHLGNPEESE